MSTVKVSYRKQWGKALLAAVLALSGMLLLTSIGGTYADRVFLWFCCGDVLIFSAIIIVLLGLLFNLPYPQKSGERGDGLLKIEDILANPSPDEIMQWLESEAGQDQSLAEAQAARLWEGQAPGEDIFLIEGKDDLPPLHNSQGNWLGMFLFLLLIVLMAILVASLFLLLS
jgi:hypothetical protein